MSRQLPLFAERSALSAQPFSRWTRKLDEVQICVRCGLEIVSRRQRDELVSEFVSNDGECWNCMHVAC